LVLGVFDGWTGGLLAVVGDGEVAGALDGGCEVGGAVGGFE